MGSIAVALVRSGQADTEIAERMLGAAPHRGADREVAVEGQAVLAVSRDGSIRDASLAREDGWVAAIAGDVDNRAELNEELARGGFQVGSDSAAATVLAAFRAWGDTAPGRMRGNFAGAVSDGTEVRFFRDQLGFQTLFLRDGDESFLAASEAKQVLAGANADREPDIDGVTDIFYGRLPERRTAVKGVERLPKASLGRAGATKGLSLHGYWDPSGLLETARLTVPEAAERLAELLEQAVVRAVSGNDAVALSGGVDSPTVAAFAAPRHVELSGRPLTAISSVYPDQPSVDEKHYIDLVSNHLGLDLHTFVPHNSPLDDIVYWVDALDGPWDTLQIAEAAETYRIARELGVRQLFTGEMAEAVATMGGPMFAHLLLHGRVGAAAGWLRSNRSRGRTWGSLAREVLPSLLPAAFGVRYARIRRDHYRTIDLQLVPAWVDSAGIRELGVRKELTLPMRKRWPQAQLRGVVVPTGPSEEADELCAAHMGLQVRMPFADVDLWEFFLSLPAEVKFPDMTNVTKELIRRAMRGRLPDEHLDRRSKTYFNEHVSDTADYEGLRRLVLGSEFRVDGVDYKRLGEGLERRDLSVNDIVWAYDLARAHAFVGLFE